MFNRLLKALNRDWHWVGEQHEVILNRYGFLTVTIREFQRDLNSGDTRWKGNDDRYYEITPHALRYCMEYSWARAGVGVVRIEGSVE